MESHKPKSFREIMKLGKPLRNVNIEQKQNLSRLDKIALWITQHVGSMGFFIVMLVWTIGWLLLNSMGPEELRFQNDQAMVLWLVISNIIQLLLLPLILIGQNLQAQYAEARAEADFEVNKKAEMEIETILIHLENQNEIMLKILQHLENKGAGELKADN